MGVDRRHEVSRETMKRNWEDPAFREKVTERAKKNGGARMKRNWEDPAFRERMTNLSREVMTRNREDPEFLRRMEEAIRDRPRQVGSLNPHWKGGEHKQKNGYVTVWTGTKNRKRSHVVWEGAHPDDPILPGEHIHHINHVRDDDRPENLEKLPARVHASLHTKGRVLSPEHRQKIREGNQKAKRTFTVKSCGKAHPGCKVCQPERYGPEWRAKLAAVHKERGTFPK